MEFTKEEATSAKIITAIDAVFTLAVEHIGMTLQLPAYHPVIVGTVIGSTYVLLKHKQRVSNFTLNTVKEAKKVSRVFRISRRTTLRTRR